MSVITLIIRNYIGAVMKGFSGKFHEACRVALHAVSIVCGAMSRVITDALCGAVRFVCGNIYSFVKCVWVRGQDAVAVDVPSDVSSARCVGISVVRISMALLLIAGAILPIAGAVGHIDRVAPALKRPAITAKQPERSVFISMTQVGQRIVAVGERGLVLLSDDNGTTWRHVITPVSVSLTAVRFSDERNGVAIGHSGVVLSSSDAGATWSVALDGERVATLALDAANTLDEDHPRKADFIADAERLASDGPDKPFLDVLVDGDRIVVIGAYGLAFCSEDAGRSWTSWMTKLENPRGMYLYGIRKYGNTLLIVGEQGLLLQSDDNGVSFAKLQSPYDGSWFTAEFDTQGQMWLAGLRGNVFRSSDRGATWQTIPNASGASITSSFHDDAAGLIFGNQAGELLRLEGDRLIALNKQPLPPINGVHGGIRGLFALTVQGIIPIKTSFNAQVAKEIN